jgi:hypothetical protein
MAVAGRTRQHVTKIRAGFTQRRVVLNAVGSSGVVRQHTPQPLPQQNQHFLAVAAHHTLLVRCQLSRGQRLGNSSCCCSCCCCCCGCCRGRGSAGNCDRRGRRSTFHSTRRCRDGGRGQRYRRRGRGDRIEAPTEVSVEPVLADECHHTHERSVDCARRSVCDQLFEQIHHMLITQLSCESGQSVVNRSHYCLVLARCSANRRGQSKHMTKPLQRRLTHRVPNQVQMEGFEFALQRMNKPEPERRMNKPQVTNVALVTVAGE